MRTPIRDPGGSGETKPISGEEWKAPFDELICPVACTRLLQVFGDPPRRQTRRQRRGDLARVPGRQAESVVQRALSQSGSHWKVGARLTTQRQGDRMKTRSWESIIPAARRDR